MNFTRIRFAVIRNNKDILCGCAGNLFFEPLDDIGNERIRTYAREKDARCAIKQASIDRRDSDVYNIVKFVETIDFKENSDEDNS